jgi:hypothetical protein
LKLTDFKNFFGWSTIRKFVVFESDDWGSIRIPSIEIKNKLIKRGFPLDSNYFTRYDTLEKYSDLSALLSVLDSFQDHHGHKPIFTTLNLVANPDFEGIERSGFSEYFFHSLSDTYNEYNEDPQKMKDIWFSGLANKLITPAFHGREHVNIKRWMRCLNNVEFENTKEFFNYRISGIHPWMAKEARGEFQAAFDPDKIEDIGYINNVIIDGLSRFEQYFGYKPQYCVPPNGCLPVTSTEVLAKEGIQFLNTLKWGFQKDHNLRKIRHLRFLGNRGKSDVLFITRNVFFEPSNPNYGDWVNKSLYEISSAFRLNKPAVICTHRVNYVSGIDPANRDRNLKLLGNLLFEIVKRWPEVEFVSTPALGRLIKVES